MSYKNEHKTLLILDLDETLVHASEEALDRPADFMFEVYHLYKRPYLDHFWQSIKDDFLLAVWSSASKDYVEEVARQIVPSDIQLEFVWSRNRCTPRLDIAPDAYYNGPYWDHMHWVKNLKKVKKQGYNLERILIVDDTPHKCKFNYGNAIYPTAYEGATNDTELLLLIKYLKTLKDKTNVRRIEKRLWQMRVR